MNFPNDILIMGVDEENRLNNLEKVVLLLDETGLRIK